MSTAGEDFESKPFLLAEDSDDDALLLARAWKAAKLPNPVVRVHDGIEVMAYLNQQTPFENPQRYPVPVAVFLDLKMPVVNGFEVLAQIRSQPKFNGLVVLVLTHSSRSEDAERVRELGANFYLTKPLELDRTVEMVQRAYGWIKLNHAKR